MKLTLKNVIRGLVKCKQIGYKNCVRIVNIANWSDNLKKVKKNVFLAEECKNCGCFDKK